MNESVKPKAIKPTDLRGILEYVPMFRGHIFVIALDGSVVAHENFANILTDIAVLRSLNINVVLVHGIGQQIRTLSKTRGIAITDAYGEGPTDAATLALACEASSEVSRLFVEGLTLNNLRCALTNAVRVAPVGILHGVDQQLTGKVEKIDVDFLRLLIAQGVVPIVNPIACDREGHCLRVNSDLLAAELASRLQASKLVYLTPQPGLVVNGSPLVNVPVEQLEEILQKNARAIDERLRSKARYAAHTLELGTPRAHILDGRVFGGLLTEIFDKVGLGTMIHANDYQQIRPARRRDVQAIYDITKNAVRNESLKVRTRQTIERDIDRFFVYEIDESIIGVANLTPLTASAAEVGSVYVQPFYQGKGVGKKLVDYAAIEASRQGFKQLVALSTQAFTFFEQVCGFQPGDEKLLGPQRAQQLRESGRHSRVLVRPLAGRKLRGKSRK